MLTWRALFVVVAAAVLAGCGDETRPAAEQPPQRPSTSTSSSAAPGSDIEAALGHAEIVARRGRPISLCGAGRAQVLVVSGRQALPAWRIVRKLTPTTGKWPVLLGSDEDLEGRLDCSEAPDPRRELAAAAHIDLRQYRARRTKSLGLKPHEFAARPPLPVYTDPKGEFTIDKDLVTGKFHPRVYLALLPTKEGWRAPALLGFGGWNDNPRPAVHAAIQRDWSRRYGAEVVSVSFDVIEARVTRPPRDPDSAIALAQEQFVYAPDIVQQGTDSVAMLASGLLDGSAWFFWWD